MNIKQAKKQIENATRAYLAKDARGVYRIPQSMQRPMVVFGPPGVGKTAVVSQVADELGINFVSYSITHHTRQSALGLPFISTEVFDGREYHVADYTMSEIIAAVHRVRKESGVDEGILFLDEVNCVSETLAPAMLQFLQFKTFGMHRLPDGWVIVCAGNPPEYNRAAREFDPAILDRIKRIDVDANLEVWQEYAVTHGVHPAVTTFLDAKPEDGFSVVVSHEEIAKKGYGLSAGQYFDVKIEHVDISAAEFKKRIADFSSALAEMSKEGAALDKAIAANLKKLELVK